MKDMNNQSNTMSNTNLKRSHDQLSQDNTRRVVWARGVVDRDPFDVQDPDAPSVEEIIDMLNYHDTDIKTMKRGLMTLLDFLSEESDEKEEEESDEEEEEESDEDDW